MERIFGKSVLLAILLTLHLDATVRMQLQNLDGQTITRATAGQPFMIQITISDVQANVQEPRIEGLGNFTVANAGYQLMVVNGVRSLQYRYQIRIDTPGEYILGPAHIANPPENSATQTIIVVAPEPAVSKQIAGGKRYAQAQPVVELVVDRDHLYVGQKLRATLRFIASDAERIAIEPFVMQPTSAMTVYHTGQPEQRQVIIDGKGYNQVELHMDMYPLKAGRIVIPAQFMDYTKESAMDAALGNFAALFGPRYERKRAHSNAVTLEVLPLPAHTATVDLVGELTRFDATIEPNVAQQYEGLVLKLIFEGDAHFAGMPTPELQQMPPELKYYRSKSDLQELAHGQQYICEYIVQGLQPGDYIIPAQTITYFDTQTGSYKTKTTTPLYITIMSGQPIHQQQRAVQPAAPVQEENIPQPTVEQSPIAPLHASVHAGTYNFLYYGLPWWLLLLLALILYASTYAQQLQMYAHALLERIAPAYMRRRFFEQIKKELAHATAAHNYQQLQHILAQVIARHMQCAPESIDQEAMMACVDATSWSLEKKQRWQQFVQRLREYLYAQHARTHDEQLFAATELWIDEFERNA